jgi:glycosyltransferase involved in cell wall biosynthesis
VEDGKNGFVVDPGNTEALAGAILKGLKKADFRKKAAKVTAEIIRRRAERGRIAGLVSRFYKDLIPIRKLVS